jgi:hypothetical protein
MSNKTRPENDKKPLKLAKENLRALRVKASVRTGAWCIFSFGTGHVISGTDTGCPTTMCTKA